MAGATLSLAHVAGIEYDRFSAIYVAGPDGVDVAEFAEMRLWLNGLDQVHFAPST